MARAQKSYQQLQAELAAILERMQSDDMDVDAMVKGYEQGLSLVAQMEAYLQKVENTVTKLKPDSASHRHQP